MSQVLGTFRKIELFALLVIVSQHGNFNAVCSSEYADVTRTATAIQHGVIET